MNEYRYETDAERARKALRLKGINLKQIHADTGIPYNTLKGYSRNLDSLYTASWSNVHRLSLYYQQHFADGIKTSDYIDTQEYINQIFFDFQKYQQHLKEPDYSDKTYKNVISKIKEIINDPLNIYEIYKVIENSKKQED